MTARPTVVVVVAAAAEADGGGSRPRRPLDRTRPVPVIAATLLRRALTTGRGRPESASTDQRLLRSLTARSI
jgi:hypothetical protein